MTIYYSIFIFWLWVFFLKKIYEEIKKVKITKRSKIYFVVAGIPLILIMGLRNISVGTDTIRYYFHYQYNTFRVAEPLYSYFTIFLNNLGVNFQTFLLLNSFIVITGISLLYYKYSKNILLSYYLHVTIGLFTMSMTGLRQTLAVSLTVFAFIALMENKKILYFAILVAAYFIHNSAIIFLIVFFIKKIELSQKKAFLIFIGANIIFVMRNFLVNIVLFIVPSRYLIYLQNDANINPLVIIASAAIPLASLLFWPKFQESKEKNVFSIFYIMSCMNLVINILAIDINLVERLTYYFIVYITVLVPNIIEQIEQKNYRILAYLASAVLPLLQFLLATPGGSLGIDNYKFFWN